MKRLVFIVIVFIFPNFCLFGQTQKPPIIDDSIRKSALNSICKALNSYYVFPDKAKLMANYLNEQGERGRYDSIANPNDFAARIVRDIRFIYNDKHLRVEYNPQLEKDILKFLSSKENASEVSATDIAKDGKRNFYFKKLEILPSNIGYIELTGFANPSLSARKTIQAAMQFVSHTDALIIDLRNNFGGNGNTGIGSYFFSSKTYAGKNFNRIENKWTENYIENKKSITNGIALSMPVYILTSKRTFSAAEGLAYSLQSLRNAVIIGDTTRGGAHLTRSFSLGSGFVGFIPYMRGENAITKTDWEGTGVIPDIVSEENLCIETALNYILTKKLDTTTNPIEKRKIVWIINYNKSKSSTVTINPAETVKFTGRYAEFEVMLQGDKLMFRDTNQSAISYKKMIPIASQFFQVENDYQVEFLPDAIKMYWNDGWEEIIQRTK